MLRWPRRPVECARLRAAASRVWARTVRCAVSLALRAYARCRPSPAPRRCVPTSMRTLEWPVLRGARASGSGELGVRVCGPGLLTGPLAKGLRRGSPQLHCRPPRAGPRNGSARLGSAPATTDGPGPMPARGLITSESRNTTRATEQTPRWLFVKMDLAGTLQAKVGAGQVTQYQLGRQRLRDERSCKRKRFTPQPKPPCNFRDMERSPRRSRMSQTAM